MTLWILQEGRSTLSPYKSKGRHTGLPLQKPTEYHLAVYERLFQAW